MKISPQYLAGILDGEGCISTTRSGKGRAVTVRVMVANTDHEFLHLLKGGFGGSLSLRKVGRKKNWRPFGSISWTGRQAQRILDLTLRYLIIKRKQAILALDLIRMRDAEKRARCDFIPAPTDRAPNRFIMKVKPSVRAIEEAIAANLTRINKKGPRPDAEIVSIRDPGLGRERAA